MTKTVRTRRAARAPSSSKRTAPAAAAISEHAFADAPGERRLHLLRLVQQSGSISQAAREAGISYKAAWQAMQRLGEQAGSPVVAASVGGAGGGGARITPAGERLLQAADLLQQAQRDAIARVNAPGSNAPDSPPAQHSMRNRLPCTVQMLFSYSTNDPQVRVALRLENGDPLLANITRESAEKLVCASGKRVLALCKATTVRIAAAAPAALPEGCCTLAGEVQAITPGVRSDEVLLRCKGGALLAGFAAHPHTLRCGGNACAIVDASTVAIALP